MIEITNQIYIDGELVATTIVKDSGDGPRIRISLVTTELRVNEAQGLALGIEMAVEAARLNGGS